MLNCGCSDYKYRVALYSLALCCFTRSTGSVDTSFILLSRKHQSMSMGSHVANLGLAPFAFCSAFY